MEPSYQNICIYVRNIDVKISFVWRISRSNRYNSMGKQQARVSEIIL